ncbi:MAG: 4-hydroxy-3-methylbut-2-enyl diphosphate reductase [SAR324 cluster bacterium]|nr:4-hydroxy-3-methylbut-2-enyl diphosphate reductase [SAR324 cluster bacterium]
MNNEFNLVLASPRGFCAGVDRAITIVEKALELYGPPIYVRHEIVHNPHVVNRLKKRGVIFVEELDTVPENAHLIFSAHGVSPAVRDAASQKNLAVLDATCPLVTKVHLEAQRYAREGYIIIMIGHKDHVEVVGTLGEAPEKMVVIGKVEEVETLEIPSGQKIAYLTQTTLSLDDTASIIQALKAKYPDIEGPKKDDICYATQNRQNAVKSLAQAVDLILVVGAPNSSNTVRLVEVAQGAGIPARRIESADELERAWFRFGMRIGITAGASAPEDIVQGIVSRLETFVDHSSIEELTLVEENVTFALPAALKNV